MSLGLGLGIKGLSSIGIPEIWMIGLDARDFQTGIGTLPFPADVHPTDIQAANGSGYFVAFAANALVRTERGLQVVPSRTEIIPDPTNIATSFTSVAGVGTAIQNADDPADTPNKAWTLTDADPAAARVQNRNQSVANDSVTRVLSTFIKKTPTAPAVYPSLNAAYAVGTGKSARAVLDTLDGEIVRDNANGNWFVEEFGDYWRVACAITNNSTGNTTLQESLTPARASALTVTVNVASEGAHVFAWPNFQVGNYPVPPILDDIAVTGNLQTLDISANAGTPGAGLLVLQVLGSNDGDVLWSRNDGTANNWYGFVRDGGNIDFRVIEGGVTSSDFPVCPMPSNWLDIGLVYAVGPSYARAQAVRGLEIAADTSVTLPAVTTQAYGGDGYSATRNAYVMTKKEGQQWGVASDDVISSLLTKANIALGDPPAIWDNFDRADGALGISSSGQAWAVVTGAGFVVPTISSKAMVTADQSPSVTAGYPSLKKPNGNLLGVGAKVAFGAGVDGGGGALVITNGVDANDIDHINGINGKQGSIHISFNNLQMNIGFYTNNNLDNIEVVSFPQVLAKDGTCYDFRFMLDGENATFFIPNMGPFRASDSRFRTLIGSYATFEPFWTNGQNTMKYAQVWGW